MGASASLASTVLVLCSYAGAGLEGAASSPSSSIVVAQVSSTFLEVTNTLLVSFGLSELFLRRRCHWRQMCLTLAAIVILNVILSPRVQRMLSFGSLTWSPFGPADGPPGVAPMLGVLRVAVVLSGFSALTYADLRRFRQHYGPKLFAEELWEAVKLVLPVYLFLVMCCSLLCLILVSLMNHLISESLGEEIIVYGQFYLPLSVVYWIMKKVVFATYPGTYRLVRKTPTSGSGHRSHETMERANSYSNARGESKMSMRESLGRGPSRRGPPRPFFFVRSGKNSGSHMTSEFEGELQCCRAGP
ncbi:unnamed protein product [Durusdinium trenchii]|uniref:Derlin n=1 Tax=Durusdinium trenchii TaxID=1381693 RepID=A0ABP0QHW8_9DINO